MGVCRICVFLALAARAFCASDPQATAGGQHMGHQGMGNMNAAGMFLMREASGTSLNPQAWPMPMVLVPVRGWNLMFMGQAFLVDTQQSGLRGHDKMYSVNWGMAEAEHRASAMEIPQAPLGHHWEDSTHIADDVLTTGLKYKFVRIEASGFYGSEPDEYRWNIDYGPINSWSTRVSVLPSNNWVAQISVGRLARPERQRPGDVVRSTASVEYVLPRPGGSWTTSLIWGRNHDTFTHRNTNAYLLESELPVRRKNIVTGRIELVDKDELSTCAFGSSPNREVL